MSSITGWEKQRNPMYQHEQCIAKIIEDKDLINQTDHGEYKLIILDGKVDRGEVNIKRKFKGKKK